MRSGVALLAVLALAFPAAARADEAAELYQPVNVAQLDLTLSDAAEQALLADPGTYVDATLRVAVGDRVLGPVPVEARLKGHTSFRPLGQKAAWKVKFAKPNRLFGLKSLTLNNMVQDPSMVHETLGYEVLRAAGVAAPRTGFAYLRVNGQAYGLYLNLETYDDISLPLLLPNTTTQHLYEADDVGVDVRTGEAGTFEVEEGDEDDLADLEALITAANATGSDWSDGMAGTADLDAMTRMWAGEQYIGHWDGYSVSAAAEAPNNYYLHSDDGGRFTMLPYGLDQTFQRRDPFPGSGRSVLSKRCRADASCLGAFSTHLDGVAAAADRIGIGRRLDAIAATVAQWRACPGLERPTDNAWQTAVGGARGFIRARRIDVAAYRGRRPPAPDPALESPFPPPLGYCPFLPRPVPPPPPSGPQTAAPASGVAGVSVSRPRRRPPSWFTARVNPALDARRPYRFTTTGSLLPPSRLSRARACRGRVAIRIQAGSRTVALAETLLRGNCTFTSTVTFRSARVFGGRTRLTVRARFKGNAVLLPRAAAAWTVSVRR